MTSAIAQTSATTCGYLNMEVEIIIYIFVLSKEPATACCLVRC